MQITQLVWDLFGSFINNHWYMCYWGISFSAWTLGMTSDFLVVNALMATKISAFSCLFCIMTSRYINSEHQQHGEMWQPLTRTVVHIPALLRARSILSKHVFLYIFRSTGAFSHSCFFKCGHILARLNGSASLCAGWYLSKTKGQKSHQGKCHKEL